MGHYFLNFFLTGCLSGVDLLLCLFLIFFLYSVYGRKALLSFFSTVFLDLSDFLYDLLKYLDLQFGI